MAGHTHTQTLSQLAPSAFRYFFFPCKAGSILPSSEEEEKKESFVHLCYLGIKWPLCIHNVLDL